LAVLYIVGADDRAGVIGRSGAGFGDSSKTLPIHGMTLSVFQTVIGFIETRLMLVFESFSWMDLV
jgi:hypothetical protein